MGSVSGSDVKDGAVTVALTDKGQDYEYEPKRDLTGGTSTKFASPFVFTQGSIVTLEAEVEDWMVMWKKSGFMVMEDY